MLVALDSIRTLYGECACVPPLVAGGWNDCWNRIGGVPWKCGWGWLTGVESPE